MITEFTKEQDDIIKKCKIFAQKEDVVIFLDEANYRMFVEFYSVKEKKKLIVLFLECLILQVEEKRIKVIMLVDSKVRSFIESDEFPFNRSEIPYFFQDVESWFPSYKNNMEMTENQIDIFYELLYSAIGYKIQTPIFDSPDDDVKTIMKRMLRMLRENVKYRSK